MAAEMLKRGHWADFHSKEPLTTDVMILSHLDPELHGLFRSIPKLLMCTYIQQGKGSKECVQCCFKCYLKSDALVREPVKNCNNVHSISIQWASQKNHQNENISWYCKNELMH
jgi:hypothetical protein